MGTQSSSPVKSALRKNIIILEDGLDHRVPVVSPHTTPGYGWVGPDDCGRSPSQTHLDKLAGIRRVEQVQ